MNWFEYVLMVKKVNYDIILTIEIKYEAYLQVITCIFDIKFKYRDFDFSLKCSLIRKLW